jgi:hypothetical protein
MIQTLTLGTSTTRPFGNAVIDGYDLDIELGSNVGYAALINEVSLSFFLLFYFIYIYT